VLFKTILPEPETSKVFVGGVEIKLIEKLARLLNVYASVPKFIITGFSAVSILGYIIKHKQGIEVKNLIRGPGPYR
jgi:hypothetical protein